MNVSLNALIYTLFIDPLLSGLREAVYEKVPDSASISWFAGSAGLTIQSSEISGNGVFTVAVCK